MKNKNVIKEEEEEEKRKRLEMIKAVAQAWLSHSDSSKSITWEFEGRRRCKTYIKGKQPSRFKLEASSSTSDYGGPSSASSSSSSRYWDFGQSLWDSYEIVTISNKLERGLALENSTFSGVVGDYDDLSRLMILPTKKRREGRNSLRSLFNRVTSMRFKDSDVLDLDN